MKVPHFDQVAGIITPYAHPQVPISIERGGRVFQVSGQGRMGSNIITILPDGWKINVFIHLDEGMNFRLVGAINRKSSFGVILNAPGESNGSEVARDLTDTAQLASDPRLAKLIPVVEDAFAALLQAAPIAAAQRTAADVAKEQADAAKKAEAEANAAAALERFRK
jgi:hypothetical protein